MTVRTRTQNDTPRIWPQEQRGGEEVRALVLEAGLGLPGPRHAPRPRRRPGHRVPTRAARPASGLAQSPRHQDQGRALARAARGLPGALPSPGHRPHLLRPDILYRSDRHFTKRWVKVGFVCSDETYLSVYCDFFTSADDWMYMQFYDTMHNQKYFILRRMRRVFLYKPLNL